MESGKRMGSQALVLAGDIGGTKTRLALLSVSGTQVTCQAEETFPSADYEGIAEIIRVFQDRHGLPVSRACFGVAGPVRNGVCATTNLPWRLDASALGRQLGIEVSLLNDLEANAWGIPALGQDDLCTLQAGHPDPAGNAAIIAAGTGLGEAGMILLGGRYLPFATEGGHADLSVRTDLEMALLGFLRDRHGHVSWERVLSGPGLVNLYEFLCAHRRAPTPAWLADAMTDGDAAAAISAAAISGEDEICVEALDLFVSLYGVEAGNLALKIMATGGVYVGGGIAPKIVSRLEDGGFLDAFLAKGRMQELMAKMPVHVILNDRAALHGPALFAATLPAGREPGFGKTA